MNERTYNAYAVSIKRKPWTTSMPMVLADGVSVEGTVAYFQRDGALFVILTEVTAVACKGTATERGEADRWQAAFGRELATYRELSELDQRVEGGERAADVMTDIANRRECEA